MFRLIVLSGLLATALAGDIASRCVIHAGVLPTSFEIVGCSSSPCALHQGEDAVIKVKFNTPRSSKSLTTLATLSMINIPIPFDLGSRSQACNALTDAACPVAAGQDLEYTFTLPIDNFVPAGPLLTFELRIVDDITEPVFCARTSVFVAAPRS